MSDGKVMHRLVEVVLVVDPSVDIRHYIPNYLRKATPMNFLGHIFAHGKAVSIDGEFLL